MPTKSESKLMFSIDGSEFREIKPPTLEVTNLYDEPDIINKFCEAELRAEQAISINYNIPNKGLFFLAIMGIEPIAENIYQYRYILQKISPNNWLRRHGLPMRRKYHGRRK